MTALLLGCGKARDKKIWLNDEQDWVGDLITVDMSPLVNPTYQVMLGENNSFKLDMFEDETFDEIGCYDALEHWGINGDWKGFFDEFAEYWRILKPNGTMGIIVPTGEARFSDPGHIRFFHPNHFGFLSQKYYQLNEDMGTCATDYRWYWKKDFDCIHMQEEPTKLLVMLRKV